MTWTAEITNNYIFKWHDWGITMPWQKYNTSVLDCVTLEALAPKVAASDSHSELTFFINIWTNLNLAFQLLLGLNMPSMQCYCLNKAWKRLEIQISPIFPQKSYFKKRVTFFENYFIFKIFEVKLVKKLKNRRLSINCWIVIKIKII